MRGRKSGESILQPAIGVVLALLGTSVLLGWWLHPAAIVRVLPAFPAMVFNTALCYALAGVEEITPLLRGGAA